MSFLLLILQRILASLTTRPSARAWRLAAIALPAFALVTGVLGFATGLLRFDILPLRQAALVIPIAFFVPALAEELLFRSWLPAWRETRWPLAWLVGGDVAFVVWHLVQPLIWRAYKPIFWRADFLIVSATLGAVCGTLRMRTGSLWPGVVFHWWVVAGWLILLGGPRAADILRSSVL